MRQVTALRSPRARPPCPGSLYGAGNWQRARGPMAEVAAERECPHRAWQGVSRDCEPDEEADFPCRAVRTASHATVTVLIPSPSEETPRPDSNR